MPQIDPLILFQEVGCTFAVLVSVYIVLLIGGIIRLRVLIQLQNDLAKFFICRAKLFKQAKVLSSEMNLTNITGKNGKK